MKTISLEEMSDNIIELFAGRGISITPIRCYNSPTMNNWEFKINSYPSYSAFNRLIKDLNVICNYQYEKLKYGFLLSRERTERQFISCGDCADSIKEAVKNDPNGEQKAYICFGMGEKYIITNLDECAHILIAGTTGSGKSVLLNSLIMQVLCFSSANLVLIDPKHGVEFGIYEDDIHDRIEKVCKDTSSALEWLKICVNEMERRFKEMDRKGIKNWDGNKLVIVIDELADLMYTSKNEVEEYIARISQKGRASGVHLIVATQSPYVSVITGRIKNCLPTKVCLKTANQMQSRLIIDRSDGVKLLGKGDGYLQLATAPELYRVQTPFITKKEIINIITK